MSGVVTIKQEKYETLCKRILIDITALKPKIVLNFF